MNKTQNVSYFGIMNEVRPTRHFGSSFMITFQFQWAVQTSSLLPTKKLISSYHMSIHPQCNASFLLEIEVEEDAQQSNTDQSLIKWMLHYVLRLWSFQEPSYRLASSVSLWRFVYSDLSGNNWLYQPKAKHAWSHQFSLFNKIPVGALAPPVS
jgi:hypothetical protein